MFCGNNPSFLIFITHGLLQPVFLVACTSVFSAWQMMYLFHNLNILFCFYHYRTTLIHSLFLKCITFHSPQKQKGQLIYGLLSVVLVNHTYCMWYPFLRHLPNIRKLGIKCIKQELSEGDMATLAKFLRTLQWKNPYPWLLSDSNSCICVLPQYAQPLCVE